MKPKAATNPQAMPCFECESGTLHPVTLDHATSHPKLGEITIPGVPMFRCDGCGDTVIGHEGSARIDAFLSAKLNSISPEEIQRFLDKYKLSQKQASAITGLGEKNICRWLNGHSRASESVSNYLRVLLADSQAFERLKQKNFSPAENATYPAEERQPDVEEKAVLKDIDFKGLAKYGILGNPSSPRDKRTIVCHTFGQPNLVDFASQLDETSGKIAAFKDTDQQCSAISSGLWILLGERAAARIETHPYHRDKLKDAIPQLRELSQFPLEAVFPEVRDTLAKAGVALVITPILAKSALRGCARLLTTRKAVINLSIKYRNYSTFWITLFHEIAHLLLHINSPEDIIPEYENQKDDDNERTANRWAYDTLLRREAQDPPRHRCGNLQPICWEGSL
jgi:HTH-type transcriptional regulator/antitoxin HigA